MMAEQEFKSTYFLYLEKASRPDIELLLVDRVWGTLLRKKYAENEHEKLFPDPFLLLVNSPKQLMFKRNSFESLSKPLKLFSLPPVSFY